jgi:hypothetical protein
VYFLCHPTAQEIANAIYNNVILQWNTLDQKVKDFYNKHLQAKDDKGNTQNIEYVVNNLGNYTLEVKAEFGKDGTGLIPKLKTGGDIEYTKDNKTIGQKNISNDTDLQEIYNKIVTSDPSGGLTNPVSTFEAMTKINYGYSIGGKIIFAVNLDRIVRNALYDILKAPIESKFDLMVPEAPLDDKKILDQLDEHRWKSEAGKIQYIRFDKTSKKFEAPKDSGRIDQLTKDLIKENNCFGTQVKKTDCQNFVTDCLMTNDRIQMKSCLEYLRNTPDIGKKLSTEIKGLHPLVVIRLCQKFGIKRIVEDGVIRLESVERWKKRLESKISRDTVNLIDENILLYFRIMVNFINMNPGLLNKDDGLRIYKTSKLADFVPTTPTEYYTQTTAGKKLGLKPMVKIPISGPKRVMTQMKDNLRLNKKYGLLIPPFMRALFGGSNYKYNFNGASPKLQNGGVLSVFTNPMTGGAYQGAQILQRNFETYITRLKGQNKTFAEEAKTRKRLNDLVKEENDLKRLIALLVEYSRLVDVFKDNKAEVLSKDQIEKLNHLIFF